MGYVESNPSMRVWNPWKDRKVLNVGGADYDEAVKRGWWLERRGGRNLEEIETVVFPADEDGAVANEDGPPAVPV